MVLFEAVKRQKKNSVIFFEVTRDLTLFSVQFSDFLIRTYFDTWRDTDYFMISVYVFFVVVLELLSRFFLFFVYSVRAL